MNTRVARQRRSRPTKYLKFELPLKYLTSLASLRGPESTRSPFNSSSLLSSALPFSKRGPPPPPPSPSPSARKRDSRKRETALESSPFARLKGRRPETVDEDDDTWFLGGEQRGEQRGRIKVSSGDFRVKQSVGFDFGIVHRGLGTRLRRVSWLLSSFKAGIVIRSFMTASKLRIRLRKWRSLFCSREFGFRLTVSPRLYFFFFFWTRYFLFIVEFFSFGES